MTDYWVDMVYHLDGRQRVKRMTTPFRSQSAADAYIDRYLRHRKEIDRVEVVPEESDFLDAIDRKTTMSRTETAR